MKDNTKEKIKKYTAAAASTVAGEAVGLAMGELLSTEDMEFENSTNPSAHDTQRQLAEDNTPENKQTPIEQEETHGVKNEVEVIDVIPSVPDEPQQSSAEVEVVAIESNEDFNDSEPSATVSDEEPEVEVELTVEEPILADNQMNDDIQNSQNTEAEMVAEEGGYEDSQITPTTTIPEVHPLEGVTDAITSVDSNGMPDYVNNANIDDFMA